MVEREPQMREARESIEMTPLWQELERLERNLGEKPEELFPGEWRQDGEFFEVGFEEGEVTREKIQEQMNSILEGGIENYWEFCRYMQMEKLMRKLTMWHAYENENDSEKREQYSAEFSFANEQMTYFMYLPEAVELVRDVVRQYDALSKKWAGSYHLGRIPVRFDKFERQSIQFMQVLNEAIENRFNFTQAMNAVTSIQLKERIPEIDKKLEELQAQEEPDEAERLKWEHLGNLVETLGLRSVTVEDLERLRDGEIAKFGPANEEERAAMLRGGGDPALQKRKNELDMRIFDILSGRKEATGLEEDFVPHQMYTELWQECNSEMRDVQEMFEREHSQNDDVSIGELVGYVENLRSQHVQEGISFVDNIGSYQIILDELARIQNQFGATIDTEGMSTDIAPRLSAEEAKELREYLDARADHRLQQLRNGLEAADEMLDVTLSEEIEHQWTTKGNIFVTELSERLARGATFILPSEENKGVAARTYRGLATLLDLPVSKEEQIKKLSGEIQEAMGWPQGKKWNELTPTQQQNILEKCKSVLDAKKEFDRESITDLRQTLDLIEKLPHASTLRGAEVDQGYVERVERMIQNGEVPEFPGRRIDKDIVGLEVAGKTVDGATAYELLFRQRRKEWGNPEEEGFMGEYSEYMHSLEENLQFNFDVAGALWRTQQAWQEYAVDILKGTGITAGGILLIGVLAAGGGVVVWEGGKFVVRRVRGSGRMLGGLRAPQMPSAMSGTVEQLTKLRYLQRERQLTSALKNTRFARWLGKMPALQNAKIFRAGGRAVRIGAWVVVPALTVYENSLIDEMAEDTDNEHLLEEYDGMKSANWLEAGGVGSTLFLGSLGPAIVLAAPVVWAGGYNRDRTEIRVKWQRKTSDWQKQYDSPGLRQELEDINATNAVEAGGGGVLASRITFPSKKDQEEAVEIINNANVGARGSVYEAYFNQNVPPARNAEDRKRNKENVGLKMDYIRLYTGGEYTDMPNGTLRRADLYAEMVNMKKALEAAGEPAILSFVEENGTRHWLDLTKLTPITSQNKYEVFGMVGDYENVIRPMQVLIHHFIRGRQAEGSTKEWKKATGEAKGYLYSQLSHHLHDAEQYIRDHDWPGWEWTGGENESRNVVRTYVANIMRPKVESLVSLMLHGKLKNDEYVKNLGEIEGILLDLRKVGDTDDYIEKASKSVRVSAVKDRKDHPMYELFFR